MGRGGRAHAVIRRRTGVQAVARRPPGGWVVTSPALAGFTASVITRSVRAEALALQRTPEGAGCYARVLDARSRLLGRGRRAHRGRCGRLRAGRQPVGLGPGRGLDRAHAGGGGESGVACVPCARPPGALHGTWGPQGTAGAIKAVAINDRGDAVVAVQVRGRIVAAVRPGGAAGATCGTWAAGTARWSSSPTPRWPWTRPVASGSAARTPDRASAVWLRTSSAWRVVAAPARQMDFAVTTGGRLLLLDAARFAPPFATDLCPDDRARSRT